MNFFKAILTGYSNANVSIFIVNGEYIRDNLDIDFVEADNDAHNPALIDLGEVWIDGDVSSGEFRVNMIHELTERRLMIEQGMAYEQAHPKASEAEAFARAHRDQLEELVQAELKLAPSGKKPIQTDVEPQEMIIWQR